MSANPIEDNATPKTTGSLEELFRHHLGEEAAVPPRPMLWDQIDNSLLIRQNETYRKRLAATRWVAAASLLLATLAGTGWWAGRDGRPADRQMAATTQPAGSAAPPAAGTGVPATGSLRTAAQPYAMPATAAGTTAPAAARGALAATEAARNTGFGAMETGRTPGRQLPTSGRPAGRHAAETPNTTDAATSATDNTAALASSSKTTAMDAIEGLSESASSTVAPQLASNTASATAATATASAATAGVATATTGASTTALAAGTDAATTALAAAPAMAAASAAPAAEVALPEQVGLLAARPAALSLSAAAALPKGLSGLSLSEENLANTSRWHYGASYTAGVFNPNINFSRAGIAAEYDYNPALGANSPALTEAAAAQYREQLRPGLTQRLALLATRHLAGHWSLRTGVELAQSTARSASSNAFVGEQLLDLGQSAGSRPMQPTNFRYRTASVPVELTYSNSAKRGWSLYGRIGGVVSALLGVRSEAEGYPEATRTYSLASAGTPYRRVLGDVRGGLGTQFRPATGSWSFTLGPVAEVGLVSLNAHPVQDLVHQSRAYSFGMEAGVEFGR